MAAIEGVDSVTLLVSDLAASYKFYNDKLGLTESAEKRPGAHAFSLRPTDLAIRQSSDEQRVQSPGHGIIVWLRTADATDLYRLFKQRDVPIVEELRSSPLGMTFSFRDPHGYLLSVHDGG
jgi:predicted enzyme related to lactoylglutathione lyase